MEREGGTTSLRDPCGEAQIVYVLDAVSSGGEPGTGYAFDARIESSPAPVRHRGTDAFHAADVARALVRLPRRSIAYGLEGARFEPGVGLSPEPKRGARDAAGRLLAELEDDR
jgi:hydrogenase maturation protease